MPLVTDHEDAPEARHGSEYFLEKPARVNRGAEVPHVPAEHGVEVVDQFLAADRHLQSVLFGFSHLVPQFPIKRLPLRIRRCRERKEHGDLVAARSQRWKLLPRMTQLEVRPSALPGE